jgi:hypothetical protein
MERMRIDLDGVPLKDPNGRVLCIFRFRTSEGIVFAIPESVDVTVPGTAIDEAALDLKGGQIRIAFKSFGPERRLARPVQHCRRPLDRSHPFNRTPQ